MRLPDPALGPPWSPSGPRSGGTFWRSPGAVNAQLVPPSRLLPSDVIGLTRKQSGLPVFAATIVFFRLTSPAALKIPLPRGAALPAIVVLTKCVVPELDAM